MNSNNPFAQYNIEHLSSQSINLYLSNIPLFIVRYLHGYKTQSNPAMIRGSVIDKAIGENLDIKTSQAEFMKLVNYYKNTGQVFDEDKITNEYSNIERYLDIGLPFYKDLGTADSYQEKVELHFDDIPIPIIGYVDLSYKDCVRDIKTTAKKPSLTPQVSRQLAIYATALEKSHAYADYLYVTKTKSEVITFELDDIDMRINEVYKISLAIMNLIQNNDIYSLVDMFYPDFSNFMWDAGSISIAKDLWRIK